MLFKVHKVYVKATSLFLPFLRYVLVIEILPPKVIVVFAIFFLFLVLLFWGDNKVFLLLKWLLNIFKDLKVVLRILVSANYNLTIFDFF